MHAFRYMRSLPITRQRWRSQQLIHISKNSVLHANLMAVHSFTVLTGLLPIYVLHCRNKDFQPFCSCDLDLNPMTFILNMIRIPWKYSGYANMIFQYHKSYCPTYIHSYIQTRPKLYTMLLHWWSKMPNGYNDGSRCN